MGEAACGKLPAAESSEEPGVQGAHTASVLWVQPACCLMDAEVSSLGGPSLTVASPQQRVGAQSDQCTLYSEARMETIA